MARVTSPRKMVVKNSNGEAVEIPIGQVTDYTEPQIDAELNLIPEFVNISSKVQLFAVPYNPNATFKLPTFGIIRGAQWRDKSKPKEVWGNTPPLMERVPIKTADGFGYDPKYLLSVEQMKKEIGRLTNRKRIRSLLENSKIVPGARNRVERSHFGAKPIVFKTHIALEIGIREMEDRPEVNNFAMTRMAMLEQKEEELKRTRGLAI